MPQDELVYILWIQRACKLNFTETLYADIIEHVKNSKVPDTGYVLIMFTYCLQVAFNFIGAELFLKREGTVYFGDSFRDVTKILRNQGHKIVYFDLEGFLKDYIDWNIPSVFERGFSIVVVSQGTYARMPGQPVHFAVPTIDMAKKSLMERGVSCAPLHLPKYHHIVIIRDPKDDGSAIVSSDANAIQKLIPSYFVSQAEHTPINKQVIFLLPCCALELELSTEKRGILNKLVRRNTT
jgi:hypothetical protein